MTTLTTRPGQGLYATVYADRTLEGYTVAVEIANESDFSPLELTKTPTVVFREVTFSLNASEVESVKDSRFRVQATKDGLTKTVASGHINYIAAKPVFVTSENVEANLPSRLSDAQLKATAVAAVQETGAISAQNRHGLSLINQDGGPTPYAKFRGARQDPYYFPLGVWGTWLDGGQADITADKAAGINTYVGLANPGPSGANLGLLATNGMQALLNAEVWSATYSSWKDNPAVIGWVLYDERDMIYNGGGGDQSQGFTDLRAQLDSLPNDGRLVYANYGKGVVFYGSDYSARRYVNEFSDISSSDIYWMTDPAVLDRYQGGKLLNGSARNATANEGYLPYNYALSFREMRRRVDPAGSKPLWNFVELGHPTSTDSDPTITMTEVRAAVWHSIIAGARGIEYFNITFGTSSNFNLIRNVPATKTYLGTLNGLIARLAPVLNSPSVSGWLTASSGLNVTTRYQGSNYYILAGSKQRASQTGTFTLSSSFGATTVEVIGESRTIPITGGVFTDTFADKDAVHIYKLVPTV